MVKIELEPSVRLLACCALSVLLPMVAGAQQPAAQTNASVLPPNVDRKAEAYADYTMGHIYQVQFENSGNQDDAAQAIRYYKKAQALDPNSIQIQLEMANTYAESDQLGAAVTTAQAILKNHPNSIDAHRLLARVYVRTLSELGQASNQPQTLALAVRQYQAILKLDPTDNEAGLWLARLYRFENQPQKAQQVLEQMLERNPSNHEAIAQYSQLLLDEGHPHQAIAELSKAAAQSSSPALYDLLGDAYIQNHDNANAEKAYRQAVQIDPGDPTVLQHLASTLFDESKYDQAIPIYQQLAAIDPSDPTSYLRLAEMYLQQKKYDLAQTNIAQAAQRAPDSIEVIYNEALIDGALNKVSDAVDLLSSAIASLKQQAGQASGKGPVIHVPEGGASGNAPQIIHIEPSSNAHVYAALYDELGRLYRQQGNYAAAIDTFQKMIPLGADLAQRGRAELIQTYRENHQIDHAITTAQQAMQADPNNRGMKVEYAYLLGEKDRTAEAVKMLQPMLNGTDADRETYLDIAQVYLSGHRYADAQKAAQKAESLSKLPAQQSAAWFMLGAIYEQQKKYGPAEAQFRKVLAVNPKDADALNYYGYMLAEEGVRLDEASAMIKLALAHDANNYAFLDSLGWVYYKQNRLTDARDYLLKAIAIRPNDPTVLGHLGDVYDSLGQTNLAVATWEKALAQWKRVAPADYEPKKVRAIERKVAEAKNSARKNHADADMPR
jgi:tetratricopeptide (TPR) repeat protein